MHNLLIPVPMEPQALFTAALRLTRARWPQIEANGLHPHDRLIRPQMIRPDEVATALAFLAECRPVSRGTITSYRLKHIIEDWGKRVGMARYVSNGATLVAADALNFRIDALGGDRNPNGLINISRMDLRRMAVRS